MPGSPRRCAAATCLGIATPAPTFVDAPPPRDRVAGFVDLHVHSGPDVYGRALDDDEAALSARRAGMGGVVLKNHASETASRAELLARRHGVEAWGGVVLNRSVGGINPDAVDAVARIEGGRGRVVWLPTVDAGNHRRALGLGDDGLEAVAGGRPSRELEAVVAVCAARDLALCTGHTGADDALVVAELCRARGVRCCITHALFPIVGFSEAHVASGRGAGRRHRAVRDRHADGRARPPALDAQLGPGRRGGLRALRGAVRARALPGLERSRPDRQSRFPLTA